MAITRRAFLKRGGLAAGSVLGSGLLSGPFVRKALATSGAGRYFVILFLDGGNDGLNTISPITNGGGSLRSAYDAVRSTGGNGLRLSPSALLPLTVAGRVGLDPNTGAELGMHPGFGGQGVTGVGQGGLHSLWQEGRVAVVQGGGYPLYSLSHDESRTIFQTANPFGLPGLLGTGWVGRHLANEFGPLDAPAATIGWGGLSRELFTNTTSVLTIRNLDDFNFPYDPSEDSDPSYAAARRAAFLGLCSGGRTEAPFAALATTGRATLFSSESYNVLPTTPRYDEYQALHSSLADDLGEVARIIQGVEAGTPNVTARFFQVSQGGYDTHSDQGGADPNGRHSVLHARVGSALRHFFDDLGEIGAGLADRVAVLVWSEFSRRPKQNDSGTDHGSQGPMFVVGGGVNGGVYGNHPNISSSALDDNGNTPYAQSGAFRSTDFRDVYGTILEHWVGLSPAAVSAMLPADARAGLPAGLQWTSPNFDLARGSDGAPLFKP